MKFICWHAPCSQYFPAGEETIKPIHGAEEVQTMKKLAGMAAGAAGWGTMALERPGAPTRGAYRREVPAEAARPLFVGLQACSRVRGGPFNSGISSGFPPQTFTRPTFSDPPGRPRGRKSSGGGRKSTRLKSS